ncbi:MAG TPA: EamA family transporter [Acidimicrobiia bacterium]|nr:EamA family transporter [Acidimicrobiia bacterium]
MQEGKPSTSTWGLFGVAVVIGAGNFLAVSVSNRELDPFWGAGLRFTLAALIFVTIALALRLKWPQGRLLGLTVVYGVVSFALAYAFLYWALLQVTPGLAAVVLAIVPLVAPILATVQGLEPLNRRAMVGAVIALAGILWITIGDGNLALPLGGLVAMLLASLTVGESVILSKRVAENHPVMTNAVGMAVGAPLLLALSLAFGETWAIPVRAEVILSVAYLVLLGSVGFFVLLLVVIRRWTVAATAYAFVLFPVVAMLLQALLLDIPLTWRSITGALLVMTGVWFGALSRSTAAEHPRTGSPAARSSSA